MQASHCDPPNLLFLTPSLSLPPRLSVPQLDFHNVLFQSMHMTTSPLPDCNPHRDVALTPEGHWANTLTHARPAVFHFNGGGKVQFLRFS